MRRSLQASWWRTLTDLLSALTTLRTQAASAAALATSLATAPFLGDDVTSDSLRASPEALDLAVFEEHLPLDGVRRIHSVRDGWLPRRLALLRMLYASAAEADDATGGGSVSRRVDGLLAALDAAEASEAATSASVPTSVAGAARPPDVLEDWRPVRAMARLTAIASGGADTPASSGVGAPADAAAATDGAIGAVKSTLLAALGAPQPLLAADHGFDSTALAQLGHLAHLVLPSLAILTQRWAAVLPGGGKRDKKKKSGAPAPSDETDGAGGAMTAAASEPRALVRQMLDGVCDEVGTLLTLIGATGRRSTACVALERQSAEWDTFVGHAAEGVAARKSLLDELSQATSHNLEALTRGLRQASTVLKHVAKSL